MRKALFILSTLFISIFTFGQAPQKMSYQAVIRDGNNLLLTNQEVGMRVTILQGSISGTEVYQEEYTPNPTTNINGLVSVEIGTGTSIIGDFSMIDWSDSPYFIKTETDPNGGTDYTISGTTQLMSVPYALYAEQSGTPGEQAEPGVDGQDGQDGVDGLSAYEIWLSLGNVGSEEDFISSLVGQQGEQGTAGQDGIDGEDGAQGLPGIDGEDGQDGTDGLSAYEIWLGLGNVGSVDDFINSLVGQQGEQGVAGQDGIDGEDGAQGLPGVDGEDGQDGIDGLSAYEIWLSLGNSGSEEDFINSLTGPQGIQGEQGIQGPAGQDGIDGEDGVAPDGTEVGEMLYWNGVEWEFLEPGDEDDVLVFKDGKPAWDKPNAYTFGDSITDENGLVYMEITNPITGRTWLDRNLGATEVFSYTTIEESYGDLYQWGRGTDGHEKRTSNTSNTLSNSDTPGHGDFILGTVTSFDWRSPKNDNLWQGVNGTNNPCPSGYKIPSSTEWEEEIFWSWTSRDIQGAINSPLKLPPAGGRNPADGYIGDSYMNNPNSPPGGNSSGGYWTSTVNSNKAMQLNLYSESSSHDLIIASYRTWGKSVRCIKN